MSPVRAVPSRAARGDARRPPLRAVRPSEPAARGVSGGAGARGGEEEPKAESPRRRRPMGRPRQRGWAVASLGEGPAPGAAAGRPRLQVSEGCGSRGGGAGGWRGGAGRHPNARGRGRVGRGRGGASSGGGDGQRPSVRQLRPPPPSWAARVAPQRQEGVGEEGLLGLEGPGSRASPWARVAARGEPGTDGLVELPELGCRGRMAVNQVGSGPTKH